ncbi:bacteriocin transport accessory protein [Brochothrix campestris FSL F6-1037]|uniref:Bacteriocin transport accessory protein n=2 Tax=Brochothrix campestris TaxID=2757 RepID=W7CS50_9LIST|nr:transport accessory protein [Brochothrix campestris]EUJ38586.1 bacteriocin transport accessory protein [Brochothrix campestris FSL F6-1037]
MSIIFVLSYFPQNIYAEESNVVLNEKETQSITDVSAEQYLSNIQGIKAPTGKELLNIMHSDETYFLYIGYESCPYCREFSRTLSSFKTQNSFPIYYVDLEINYSTDLSSEEFTEFKLFFDKKIGALYTPTFVRIEHKTPVSGFIGGSTTIQQLQSINS